MSRTPEGRESRAHDPEPAFRVVDRRPNYDAAPEPLPGAAGEPGPAPDGDLRARATEAERRAEEAERRAREISAAYRAMESDRDAFRERLTRDLERRVEFARAGLMRKVVEILDDFDRAVLAARGGAGDSSLLQGVAMTRDRLLQVLVSEGVQAIDTVGRPFDPEVAEAIATEPVDDPAQDGIVLTEETPGYTLRGALLRPARVRVGRAAGEPQTSGAPPHPGD